MASDPATVERVKAVLMKYCNPKKEFDHIPPSQVVEEIISAVNNSSN